MTKPKTPEEKRQAAESRKAEREGISQSKVLTNEAEETLAANGITAEQLDKVSTLGGLATKIVGHDGEIAMPGPGAAVGLEITRKTRQSWKTLLFQIQLKMYQVCLNHKIDIEADDFRLAVITLPCGCKVKYKQFKDIPKVSTPCDCGKNWFINYVERIPCDVCKGSGRETLYNGIVNRSCRACGGTGILKEYLGDKGDDGHTDDTNRSEGNDQGPASVSGIAGVPYKPE